jgi:hypothetical protein
MTVAVAIADIFYIWITAAFVLEARLLIFEELFRGKIAAGELIEQATLAR